ncbi:Cu(I)-responsive transcriptional regulator [Bdellovibrio sp. SKB1291214]|uniref:Cu(I)-responsive transcriptional regulator n=1 Tax=Bdellovibrio sp. SKB1291214 TaxID=1732569 RepID=UPI000B51C9AC|nr:Cu(I)-responsive transcriptional regulator [Bdellovibrio sp. SKB1291214]UYL07427.1 Cu(I)-responsive transcriptional regulator [Bdellovibrio sp. SKB1291214]
MNIGDLAKLSGVNAKLIRHYESIGIIPKAARTDSGYRSYTENDVQFLRFIKRARSLGFSMKEIKKLVSLWRNKSRASRDVKALAFDQIEALEKKIKEMQEMLNTLQMLAKNCHGDNRPDCPIIKGLEG